MIITKLMGGLGNQMFQYAAGRNLTVKLQSELKIDPFFLETDTKGEYTKRHYELNVFNSIQTKPTDSELNTIKQLQKTEIQSRLYNKVFLTNNFTIFNEKNTLYNSAIEKLHGNIYLNGFWQSEKYFSTIRETLLKEFSLKQTLSTKAENAKIKILSDQHPVSIHFRRGDYVHLVSANTFHGTTELDYYHSALDVIKAKITNPSFYIFSDDMNWVKENFKIEKATYIEELKSYEDLELMKTCKHNIIANSSFSWWGAWLNDSPGKIIITPKQWFKDKTIDTSDLIPAAWLRI